MISLGFMLDLNLSIFLVFSFFFLKKKLISFDRETSDQSNNDE